MENSVLKNKLKSLCCSHGWSYGVFWRYDHRNSMLLTFGDAYYEEQIGLDVENLLLQVHILGEGIVGRVAFTGMRHWMFSDAQSGGWKSAGDSGGVFKDFMFDCQTSCGIKTIAVISVKPWGVVQFGSTQKILESADFIDQTHLLFQDVSNADGVIPLQTAPSFFEHEANDNSGLLGSIVASGKYLNRNQCQGIQQLSSPNSSIVSDKPSAQLQQQSHFSSEVTLPNADRPSIGVVSPPFCESTVRTEFQNDSTFDPLDIFGEFVEIETFEPDSFDSLITSSLLTSSNQESEVIFPDISNSDLTFPKENTPAEFIEDISEFFSMDDLSQWFNHSPSHGTAGTETMISQSTGLSSISSSLLEGDLFTHTPIMQEEFFHVNATGTHMSTAMGMNQEHVKAEEFCKNQVNPIESSTHSAITAAESDCVSELIASSMAPRRDLFSELGLRELLDGFANSSSVTSSFEDGPLTTKRRKIESPLVNCSQVELGSLPPSVGSLTSVHDRESSFLPKKEFYGKSQVGLWIDDNYRINVGNAIGEKPKRPEEPTKISRRRARPGESTRPRPKDRQQIQDRLKDLRGIVPNGQKTSIDLLLDRTIRYMLFLQGVTKYADKLIQVDEPQLIDQENGVILKDGYTDNCSRGATWAYEKVGSQKTVCPIIVEDLSTLGQMRIEMLCEDRGLFLEISDVVRGIGLNILKGVMEMQGTKIRARFTVEANRHVTRMDIFWSLVQFLQDTAISGIDRTDQLNIATDVQIPSLSSCQERLVSHPIS